MKYILIGPGNIARFHISAFNKIDSELIGILPRDGSSTVHKFCKEFDIKKVYSSIEEVLLEEENWDAAIVTCPTMQAVKYVKELSKLNKPVLVEKPVSHNVNELYEIKNLKNIMVGFNRRFYSNIIEFKEFVQNNNPTIFVNLPEVNIKEEITDKKYIKLPYKIYDNSVHVFDILNYILGSIEWVNAVIMSDNKIESIIAHGVGRSGIPINLNICFNSSQNFLISATSKDQSLELMPLEVLRSFRGMDVNEPTSSRPFRIYKPNKIREVSVKISNNLKPGFYEQAKLFSEFCSGNIKNITPNLNDAYEAILSISNLEKLINSDRSIKIEK